MEKFSLGRGSLMSYMVELMAVSWAIMSIDSFGLVDQCGPGLCEFFV